MAGKTCGGFALQLSWQPGFSSLKKPVKRTIVRRAPRRTLQDSSVAPQFEFINEHFTEFPDDHGSVPTTVSSQSPIASDFEVHSQEENVSQGQTETCIPELSEDADLAHLELGQDPVSSAEVDVDVESQINLYGAQDRSQWTTTPKDQPSCPPKWSELDLSFREGHSIPSWRGLQAASQHALYTIPPVVLYTGHLQRLEPVFERYNKEFCVIPLTSDLPINPFRYRQEALQQSDYLLHAVLALSCHHTENVSSSARGRQGSETVLEHGRVALQLFRQALNGDTISRMSATLLDTIVVLFSLDEAYSLVGSWTMHLTGAFTILEACGGVEVWTKNPRTVVQVALFTWWDAVVSLVNRTPCVFPYEYFESVLACCDEHSWTFYGLCGCPQSLVVLVVQLAHLAAEKQKSKSMRWVPFDDALVSEIEQSLQFWSHPSPGMEPEDEESIHQDMDCLHCSEAWRNGLLLYIYRVFRWEPGTTPPVQLARRARVILDHVSACRDDQFVARQALLPLFFAGCELTDLSAQNRIRNLCSAWNERTRYHMFGGMIPLLEDVWSNHTIRGSDVVWWGQVVDKMGSTESRQTLQLCVCFG